MGSGWSSSQNDDSVSEVSISEAEFPVSGSAYTMKSYIRSLSTTSSVSEKTVSSMTTDSTSSSSTELAPPIFVEPDNFRRPQPVVKKIFAANSHLNRHNAKIRAHAMFDRKSEKSAVAAALPVQQLDIVVDDEEENECNFMRYFAHLIHRSLKRRVLPFAELGDYPDLGKKYEFDAEKNDGGDHITASDRRLLLRWMREKFVGASKPIKKEFTFHLAVSYFDRTAFSRDKRHARMRRHAALKTATAAVWLALKYEGGDDAKAIKLSHILLFTGTREMSKQDLKDAELSVLTSLRFDLSVPTVYELVPCILIDGLRRWRQKCAEARKTQKKTSTSFSESSVGLVAGSVSVHDELQKRWQLFEQHIDTAEQASLFLCEVALFDESCNVAKSSVLAAACVVFVRAALQQRAPNREDVGETWPYDPDDAEVWSCVCLLITAFCAATRSHFIDRGSSKKSKRTREGSEKKSLAEAFSLLQQKKWWLSASQKPMPPFVETWADDWQAVGVDCAYFAEKCRVCRNDAKHSPVIRKAFADAEKHCFFRTARYFYTQGSSTR